MDSHGYLSGADPGFPVRGAHLKKMRRAEGGAKIVGVFRVKNHDFTPKNDIFSNFRGGVRQVRLPLDAPLSIVLQYNQEEVFEDTKGVIRIHISKMDRVKVQKDKLRSTKHTHKTKDRVTRIPLKTAGDLGCSGRVSGSCLTSGARWNIYVVICFRLESESNTTHTL